MDRIEVLSGFINALREAGIIDFNISLFNHRLKMQKYVYLARRYGFDLNYAFSLYIHGPYSPALANDYYELNIEKVFPAPVTLNKNFVSLVKGKSEKWLELAATIVLVKERYANIDEETVKRLVKNSKPFATDTELDKIIKELKLRRAID